MNPVDAVRLALEAPAPDPDELRALAERCVAVGDPGLAELACALAALVEVDPYAPMATRKKVDNQMSQAHGCA